MFFIGGRYPTQSLHNRKLLETHLKHVSSAHERLALAFLVVLHATARAQPAGITQLDAVDTLGSFATTAYAVSSDGKVVVGDAWSAPVRAFRWTQAGGMSALGNLANNSGSFARATNRDGSVAVGHANGSDGSSLAFRWTPSGGMVSLGMLNGGFASFATGVSGDGSIVVGQAIDGAAIAMRAFRWTQAEGMISLGVFDGGIRSGAAGISSDGSVIVGWSAVIGLDVIRAFRWTRQTGMVNLGLLNGGTNSDATAVSSDGTVIVGAANDGAAGDRPRAFRWTQALGMVSLGTLGAGNFSEALAVNSDGSVVVGRAFDASVNARAFRWTQATGLQSVEDWLRAHGVNVPADVTRTALGVSSDGDVIVGELSNSAAFIARLSDSGNGIVTLQDLQPSLSGNATTLTQATDLASLVLHGLHSRPLKRQVQAEKSCFWTAGDVGDQTHRDQGGQFVLAEIGGCHRFAHGVQANISVGRGSSRQDLVFDGRAKLDATHGVVELLGNVSGTQLRPSAALLYQEGNVDVRRGYPNGGAQDYSSGRSDVRVAAARLRVDWEDAARFAGLTFSPYADLSHSRTRIDGYTEAVGAFPAKFEPRKERVSDLRIGGDLTYSISANIKLFGGLEAAYRFQRDAASTSGTVLGLFSFDIPRQSTKRNWFRTLIGVEAKLTNGVATVMLNSSTQGLSPTYWLNASYQIAF